MENPAQFRVEINTPAGLSVTHELFVCKLLKRSRDQDGSPIFRT